MEQHEHVEIRIEWREGPRGVERVVVLDERRNLHVMGDTLDDRAVWVGCGALGERVFGGAVLHGFGPDEDKVEGGEGEHVG